MPQNFRVVIFTEVKKVDVRDPVSGEVSQVDVTYRTYRLAFGGRLICRELNDKNLLVALFAAYQFCGTFHPEVVRLSSIFKLFFV